MRDEVAGDFGIHLQRFGFPRQHVWAVLNEALIFKQPRGPARATLIRGIVGGLDGSRPVWNRMCRIRDIAIGLRLCFGWWIIRELSVRAKIKVALGDVRARRPGLKRRPTIRACLERQRFRLLELSFVL